MLAGCVSCLLFVHFSILKIFYSSSRFWLFGTITMKDANMSHVDVIVNVEEYVRHGGYSGVI